VSRLLREQPPPIVYRSSFCWKCGVSPASPTSSVGTPALAVPIDRAKLAARRAQVAASLSNKSGPKRKRLVAELFDTFLRALSEGQRGKADATPDDVFDYLFVIWTRTEEVRNGCTTVRARV